MVEVRLFNKQFNRDIYGFMLLDKNLTPLDKAVLAIIQLHSDVNGGWDVEMSSAELSKQVNCSKPTLTSSTKKLSKLGWLTIKYREGEGGRNVYVLKAPRYIHL